MKFFLCSRGTTLVAKRPLIAVQQLLSLDNGGHRPNLMGTRLSVRKLRGQYTNRAVLPFTTRQLSEYVRRLAFSPSTPLTILYKPTRPLSIGNFSVKGTFLPTFLVDQAMSFVF